MTRTLTFRAAPFRSVPPRGTISPSHYPAQVTTPTTGSTLDDPLQEALRLIRLATEAGLVVRLMGGLAFHALVPDWTARVQRGRRDIDLATRNRDSRPLAEFLASE